MPTFTYPNKPKPGDQVAVISPSAGLPALFPDVYELGLRRLRDELGLVPVEYPTTRVMGASAADRARDIHDAFADPSIRSTGSSGTWGSAACWPSFPRCSSGARRRGTTSRRRRLPNGSPTRRTSGRRSRGRWASTTPDALVVFDVHVGHTDPQLILPIGGTVRVDGPAREIAVHY